MKEFDVKTKIYFGENALKRLSELKTDKAFVVADPFVVRSGLIDFVIDPLKEANIDYYIFSDVVPDPPLEKVVKGVSEALDFGAEYIVAIGGGSAMDTSKAIRKFAGKINGAFTPKLVCIPTTSGTGSEVTSFAVLSDVKNNAKIPLASEDMVPDEAILDEVLVKSVPPEITADTGMDTLTHAIEAYVSVNNNEFSGALAEKAVEICGQFLLRSYNYNGDAHARRKVHIASCLAGLAFNSASLGLCHGMAHQLGAQFHIAHGRANAILLPHIIEYNSEIGAFGRSKKSYPPCVRKYCNMARVLGVNNLNEVTTIRAFVSYIQYLMMEMSVPLNISEMGRISREDYEAKIDIMAKAALADACTATNPRVPSLDEIKEIYRAIW
ncbi:MAG: iron-containing alcohol dehydrogenase [Clostridia bacterium]|nr:iron-containing alcohol dehydrogenase [Clostridia bacterium]